MDYTNKNRLLSSLLISNTDSSLMTQTQNTKKKIKKHKNIKVVRKRPRVITEKRLDPKTSQTVELVN